MSTVPFPFLLCCEVSICDVLRITPAGLRFPYLTECVDIDESEFTDFACAQCLHSSTLIYCSYFVAPTTYFPWHHGHNQTYRSIIYCTSVSAFNIHRYYTLLH
ncbi:unnamed protein product [Calicophoron daubneyi]|uniref:Secreted protein n=1 Tax=Calicophoron daubneyi TaxID=300641 RepID=A0AAV2T6C9_CALDB